MTGDEAYLATLGWGVLLTFASIFFALFGVCAGAIGAGLKRKWGLVLSALFVLLPPGVGLVFSLVATLQGAFTSAANQVLAPIMIGLTGSAILLAGFVIVGWLTYYHFGDFGKTQPSPWR